MGNGRPIHIAAELDHLACRRFRSVPMARPGRGLRRRASRRRTGVQLASATRVADCRLPSRPAGWKSPAPASRFTNNCSPHCRRQGPAVCSLAATARTDRFSSGATNGIDPSAVRGDTSLELKLADCAIQYERFPYPLATSPRPRHRPQQLTTRSPTSSAATAKVPPSSPARANPKSATPVSRWRW